MATKASATREYLDLSKDPVLPKGVSAKLAKQAEAEGWVKAPLESDVYAHVQFKSRSNGLYYRDGWVKAGTEVFSRSTHAAGVFDGFEMVGGCGNVMIRHQPQGI